MEHFIGRFATYAFPHKVVFICLTIDSSTLSHDFYQVMVGSQSMSLHGWRVLAEWSIEHSCMADAEKSEVKKKWLDLWNVFCQWIVDEYGAKYPASS
jgi:adenosine deaminase CECR1